MDGAFPSNYAGGGRGPPRTGFRGTAENAKTKLCTRWMAGECRFGDRCNFAHGEEELRALPPREGGPPRGGYGGGGRGYGGGGFGGRGRGGYDNYGGGYGGPGGGYGGGYPGGYEQGGYGGGPPGGYGAPAPHGGYGAPQGGPNPSGRPAGMTEDQWAAQGYPVQGPSGWVMYRTKDTGEAYYHNYNTNETVWDRPAEWPANLG